MTFCPNPPINRDEGCSQWQGLPGSNAKRENFCQRRLCQRSKIPQRFAFARQIIRDAVF